MIKNFVWILLLFVSFSCTKQCYEEPGELITKELELPAFETLIVNTGVRVSIIQADTQQIKVVLGENKWDNFHAEVTDGVLEVQADSPCTFQPSLEPAEMTIAVPNIKTIRNASQYTITSKGVLTFPYLNLLTENYQNGYANLGDFDLELDNHSTVIISNGLSIVNLRGKTRHLYVRYYAGIGRFEGKDLKATHVYILHKGNNTLKVNPQETLQGDIYANGDVVSYNHPEVVEVEEHFTGALIFE